MEVTNSGAASGREGDVAEAVSMLSATLESTADGILVVDSSGKIARMNKRFAELWRIPHDVLEARDDAQAIEFVLGQLSDPDAFVEKVRHLYENPEAESFDILMFKDGRVFERYSMCQRVNDAVVGRVWSFRDITERRRLEDQLRQSQKMEAIGLLAGGIAHDFNNLLTVIQLHGELLTASLDATDERREDLNEMIRAADRATELTRQLLAFGRKQIMRTAVMDLNEVVTGVEPMLRRLISADIEIVVRLEKNAPFVLTDRGQMEQAILNLAINARDAMPGGGRLTIETSRVTVGANVLPRDGVIVPAGHYVSLVVTDTGVGIRRDQLPRVFEPFYTTKEMGKGTGLGLSTIYGIVKQLEGFIWVTSEEKVGTTFTIYLRDAGGGEVGAGAEIVGETLVGGTETILVVEDEVAVRNLLHRVLRAQGYRVLEAGNGEEALAVAAAHRGGIDMLLTDIVMPVLGGIALAERLQAMRPGIRVLFVSGHTRNDLGLRGSIPEFGAFLQKPFSIAALTQTLRSALDGKTVRRTPF